MNIYGLPESLHNTERGPVPSFTMCVCVCVCVRVRVRVWQHVILFTYLSCDV